MFVLINCQTSSKILVYNRNIFSSSSEFFGHLRQSSETFAQPSDSIRSIFEEKCHICCSTSSPGTRVAGLFRCICSLVIFKSKIIFFINIFFAQLVTQIYKQQFKHHEIYITLVYLHEWKKVSKEKINFTLTCNH